MVHLKTLGAVLLMAGMLAALPLRADDRLGEPAGNAVTPFEVASGDEAKLSWLQRWSEGLKDPLERFAALSDGWSASEQSAIAAWPATRIGRRPDFEPSQGFTTSHRHLAQIRLLAELRLRQGQPGSPEGLERHLCNAVRLNREWLLSSAGCVTLQAELAGLEAQLDTADLAAANTLPAPVERIVRQPAGALVLLHLGGNRELRDPGPLYWLGASLPKNSRSHLLSWGRPMPAAGLPTTLFRHIELVAAYGEVCDIAAEPGDYLCLVQAGARLCPGDDGSPVYFVAEDGTASLKGMVALREQQCFVSTAQELRPAPVIDLNRHRAWIEATIAPATAAGR